MTKKRLFAILFSILAFSAVVGAGLANAAGDSTPSSAVDDGATPSPLLGYPYGVSARGSSGIKGGLRG